MISKVLRVAVPLGLAVLFLYAFDGFSVLNALETGQLRQYGRDWYDRVPPKEAALFLAIVFLAGPAALFGARGLDLLAGDRIVALARRAAARPALVLAVLVGFALVAVTLVGFFQTQYAPFTDDEWTYRFQVSLLHDGLLKAPAPPGPARAFHSWFIFVKDGMWTGVYPWGHIGALTVGSFVGFLHLVPHLSAPVTVLLAYRLGRELFPDDVAASLIGAGLVATSPFLAYTCSTLHSVSTSVLVTTGGALAFTLAVKRASFGWALVAGLIFSYGLHARPFNAMLTGSAMGLAAFVACLHARRGAVALTAGFVLGILPGVLLQLYINHELTGAALTWITDLTNEKPMFGFGAAADKPFEIAHTPTLAFGKQGTNFLRLALWASGSVLSIGLIFAPVLGFMRRRLDALLYLPVAALFFGYFFFYTSPTYDTGPLYYLDAVPFLALIGGRAIMVAGSRFRPAAVAALVVAMLAVSFATFWRLEGSAARRASNRVLGPYRAVERAGLKKAIVFYVNPPETSWVWLRKSPSYDLRDDVLWVRDIPEKAELLKTFPDRAAYTIRYPNGVPTVMRVVIDEKGGVRLEPL